MLRPRVCFGVTGPSPTSLRADGYRVERRRARFTLAAFENVNVLVVAHAAGASRTQFWGFNLSLALLSVVRGRPLGRG